MPERASKPASRPSPEIIAAIIAGVASVLVGALSAWVTLKAAGTDLREATASAKKVNASLQAVQIPVGTVIASTLSPEAFTQASGNPEHCDSTSCLWVSR